MKLRPEKKFVKYKKGERYNRVPKSPEDRGAVRLLILAVATLTLAAMMGIHEGKNITVVSAMIGFFLSGLYFFIKPEWRKAEGPLKTPEEEKTWRTTGALTAALEDHFQEAGLNVLEASVAASSVIDQVHENLKITDPGLLAHRPRGRVRRNAKSKLDVTKMGLVTSRSVI